MKTRDKKKKNNKKKAQRKTPIAPAATHASPAEAFAILQQATPNLTVFQAVNEEQMAHLIKTRQSIENVILAPTKPNTTISMKLTSAAILGQRSDVQKFLELGADPNCALGDGNGNTPLIGAAECGNAGSVEDVEKREQICADYRLIVWLLIKRGADINLCNQLGMSPLNVAAELSDLKMVALLIKLGATIDVVDSVNHLTALGIAATHNRTDIMTLLIEHGACVNAINSTARSPIYLAARNGHVDAVRLLLLKGARVDEQTPEMNSSSLFIAIAGQHEAVVSALLEAGANPNQTLADGDSALLIATDCGHIPIARRLLQHGAKVDTLSRKDSTSALYFAAQTNQVDMMKLLIEFGANINLHCKSTGSSALHFALYNGYLEIAKLLLAHGAYIDERRDEDGATPLFLAIIGGNPVSVAFALQHGADVNLEINTHAQPLAYALIMNEYSQEITRLLIQHILKSSPIERSCLSGVAARLCKAGNATPLLLLINALLEQNVPGRAILNLLPVVSSHDKTNAMNHPDFVGTLDLMRRKYMPNARFINLEDEKGSPAVKNLDRAVSYVVQKISKFSLSFFQEPSKNSNETPTMKNRM